MSEAIGTVEVIWQRRNRLRRIIKRRKEYLLNFIFGLREDITKDFNAVAGRSKCMSLLPGNMVRVRSREEIKATLDRWNQLKRCSFMEEMWPYCETTQRVFKRVAKFLDERDYLLKSCKGVVTLDGVFCEGTKDFGPCDRSCFFFWREEWLERIDP